MSSNQFRFLDISQFPRVVMNAFPTDMDGTEQWVHELQNTLDKKTDFVLIYPPLNHEKSEEDMESMKYVRRWLKEGKALMTQYCKGMIVTVNEENDDKADLEKMMPMISAIYGAPGFIADNKVQAQAIAASLV